MIEYVAKLEPHAMNVLPIDHMFFYVHGKGLTSLHHNQYTGNLFIQASEHPPSCWTRFGENCKTTKPSPGLSMLLKKKAMDVLTSILHMLLVHGQGLPSLKHNQYIGILSI